MTGNTPRKKTAGRVVSPGKWGLQGDREVGVNKELNVNTRCDVMRNDLEQALNV